MSSTDKIRVAMAGDSLVGKTSLICQHLNEHLPDGHTFKIGTDYKIHIEQSTKFQIWDLSGHERFQVITNAYFRNIDAVIYMFSFDNYDSFRHLSNWKNRVRHASGSSHLIEVIIGNKVDCVPHEITPHEIHNLLNRPEWKHITYFECNSILNIGIDEVFNELIRQRQRQRQPLIKVGARTPLLPDQKQNCCCTIQ